MRKLTFELEFITPAFIGNAQQQAELRPASFVGLLRWWWRALKGLDDTKKLYEEEVKIFGGYLKNGAVAGKVNIRLVGDIKPVDVPLKEKYKLSWSYNPNERRLSGNDAGIGYLLYSVNLPNKERKFIDAGSRFKLILLGEEEYLRHAVASLWALVYLGGVGARSRRGGGNLDCVKVEPNIDWLSFEPEEKLGKWLSENLKKAIDLVDGGKDFCAEYSNLSFSRIIISNQEFNSWREALNSVGKEFMDFRHSNKSNVFEMSAFGLPIRHGNNQFVNSTISQRRASPLIIKLLRVKEKYRWIMLRLSGKFLPEGEFVEFGRQKQSVDYSLLEEFRLHLVKNKIARSLKLTQPESLNVLIQRIVSEFNPERVILFGPHARGDTTRSSKIHIAVDTDKPINKEAFGSKIELVNMKTVNQDLMEKISKEGVLLYEKQA